MGRSALGLTDGVDRLWEAVLLKRHSYLRPQAGISQRTQEHSPESAAYLDEMATFVQAVVGYTV